MGKILKYLLPFIVGFLFWGSAEDEVHVADQVCDMAFDADASQYQQSLSEPFHDVCLPRQISISGPARVQNTARKTGGVQRTGLEFTKSGKVFNAGVRYFIQNNRILSHSSLTEPGTMLISLKRLII